MTDLAVIDLETTGINPYRHDRIVEIAIVVIKPDGSVQREFTSLINPERDIGPTRIHGLTSSDVLSAPRFSDIAGDILEALNGCIALSAHNARFERNFLSVEYDRLGHAFPEATWLCTLQMAGGGSLSTCCTDYEIPSEKAHAALFDARCAAKLLASLLKEMPDKAKELMGLPSIAWPTISKSTVRPVTRGESALLQTQSPPYLQRLLARMDREFPPNTDESAVLAYNALLDRVLEDRVLDEAEGDALVEIASRWELHGNQVMAVHEDYLQRLAIVALADGVITEAERNEIALVARLLGIDAKWSGDVLDRAVQKLSEITTLRSSANNSSTDQLAGKVVCFTGECQCNHDGEPLTREKAAELAESKGMKVVESVTKKLDILVVADPTTQSGKAKKARQYGIRVLHEPVFWRSLGIETN